MAAKKKRQGGGIIAETTENIARKANCLVGTVIKGVLWVGHNEEAEKREKKTKKVGITTIQLPTINGLSLNSGI